MFHFKMIKSWYLSFRRNLTVYKNGVLCSVLIYGQYDSFLNDNFMAAELIYCEYCPKFCVIL